MNVDRGHEYGDLIVAMLEHLDPPDDCEMLAWTIRSINDHISPRKNASSTIRPKTVAITLTYTDRVTAGERKRNRQPDRRRLACPSND